MAEPMERVERLLAMILVHDMKDAPQGEKASALSHAGLTNAEIAEVLGTTGAVISQQLYALRKSPPKKSRPRKKK